MGLTKFLAPLIVVGSMMLPYNASAQVKENTEEFVPQTTTSIGGSVYFDSDSEFREIYGPLIGIKSEFSRDLDDDLVMRLGVGSWFGKGEQEAGGTTIESGLSIFSLEGRIGYKTDNSTWSAGLTLTQASENLVGAGENYSANGQGVGIVFGNKWGFGDYYLESEFRSTFGDFDLSGLTLGFGWRKNL